MKWRIQIERVQIEFFPHLVYKDLLDYYKVVAGRATSRVLKWMVGSELITYLRRSFNKDWKKEKVC